MCAISVFICWLKIIPFFFIFLFPYITRFIIHLSYGFMTSKTIYEYIRKDSSQNLLRKDSTQHLSNERTYMVINIADNNERLNSKEQCASGFWMLCLAIGLTIAGVSGIIIAIVLDLDTDLYILAGALVSCVFCLVVILSYSTCLELQRYPNQLMFHKR